ncbi:hypothetical protein [Microvirga yunnanensis]|uniref:hypothetical protein n=1 Tax=Microvirga yunnanensis TaxID=2953740 RepID=UPI0021C9176A|nr:hypothetical protein [Microvirga sp. HBU65207]
MPVAPADVALVVFTACNTARVFAYLPQIVKIGRDTQGATAISYTTWILFGVSHLSTVAYAILVVDDWRMAAVFAANTLCCVLIVGLTAWKRAALRTARGRPGDGKCLHGRERVGMAAIKSVSLHTDPEASRGAASWKPRS